MVVAYVEFDRLGRFQTDSVSVNEIGGDTQSEAQVPLGIWGVTEWWREPRGSRINPRAGTPAPLVFSASITGRREAGNSTSRH